MRLIDADKLEYYQRWEVDEAPTVDAVPFSFLEKLRDNAQNEEAALMIDEIITLWRIKECD